MATTSKVCNVQRNTRQAARQRNRSTKQAESRTKGTNYNGFLKHVFKPFYNVPVTNWRKTEGEFFYSLSNLCRLYGWVVPDTSHLDYPLNVATAFEIVKNKCLDRKLNCLITNYKRNRTSIATTKTYDTGYTLYYIPVKPVWQILQKEDHPILTEIWLMLYRYLYQIGKVSYYRQGSYLNRIYEILQNWIDEDCDSEDEAYKKEQQETLNTMQDAGDRLFIHIRKKFNAGRLQYLLQQYRLSGYYEVEMEKIIKDCLQLWTDYPNRSVYDDIDCNVTIPEQEEIIYLDTYLSFFWSGYDCLYDTLMEMINNELMEMSHQQEPVSLQCFDKPQVSEQHNFDFVNRFFELMEEISDMLNKMEKIQSQETNLKQAA